MPRIKMELEYDGTGYAGWQRQERCMSVQQAVEEAIERLTGQKTVIHASGRTDSSVHALGQVIHFDTDARISGEKFPVALNSFLPKDIRALNAEEVRSEFHARYHAKAKMYRYTIDNARHASALYRNFQMHVHKPLCIEAMQEASDMLIGTHDFAAFQSTGSMKRTTIRTITMSEIKKEGRIITYTTVGNGYLYNMVRIIVGTLIEIGLKQRTVKSMQDALISKNRLLAGSTAPPHGLALIKVYYDDFSL